MPADLAVVPQALMNQTTPSSLLSRANRVAVGLVFVASCAHAPPQEVVVQVLGEPGEDHFWSLPIERELAEQLASSSAIEECESALITREGTTCVVYLRTCMTLHAERRHGVEWILGLMTGQCRELADDPGRLVIFDDASNPIVRETTWTSE